MSTVDDKKTLRQRLLAHRQNLDGAAQSTASQAVIQALVGKGFTKRVGLYAPIQGELDLTGLEAFAEATAYPRVVGKKLDWHYCVFSELKAKSRFGIWEPDPQAPRCEPQKLQAILVPALAFTQDGYRLGYGGGYFDRLITHLKEFEQPPLMIGVGHHWQVLDALPLEAHDQPLDLVVTDEKFVSTKPAGSANQADHEPNS